jgi:hypothetical protein
MAPMLIQNQLLLAKVETTYGVDAVPTKDANAILAGPVDTSLDLSQISSNAVRRSISAPKIRIARKMVNFTIRIDLRGSGAAGTPPEISALLQACGLTETISEGVDVQYVPNNEPASMKSCTIYFYYDGRVRKAVGCMGNATIETPAGGLPGISFSMRGRLTTDEDAALPTSPTFQTVTPVVVEQGALSFGSFNDAVIRSFSMNTNNTIIDRADINSAEGVKGVFVTRRDPGYSSQVEATLESVKAWFAALTGRTEEAIDITLGSSAGNIVEIDIPKACLNAGVDPQDDNGMIVFPLAGQMLENLGGDNFTLTFK